jgi:hypothetical protein
MISAMTNKSSSPRFELFRETAILQLKLLADGFRDAALIPISLIAGLVGFVRGGEDCDRAFRQVLKLGRRSERWINLFGHQKPLGIEHPAGSMDKILEQVEAVVIEQYQKGKTSTEVREAVRKSMKQEDGAQ